uniref:Secreted protein n=1 Tax=Rhipicephalus appendiculatus TaxID=34631 RepID=A0A131YA94_RHIAP
MQVLRQNILLLQGLFCLLSTLGQLPMYVVALNRNSNRGYGPVYYVVGQPPGTSNRLLHQRSHQANDATYSLLGKSTNPHDRANWPLPPTPNQGVSTFPRGPRPDPKRYLKPGISNRNTRGLGRKPVPAPRQGRVGRTGIR